MLFKESAGHLAVNISRSNDRYRIAGIHRIECAPVSEVSGNRLALIPSTDHPWGVVAGFNVPL